MTTQLRVLTVADSGQWRALLPASFSAFGSLEFARIAERHTGYRARLFAFTGEDAVVAYPSLLRPISGLSFAGENRIEAWDSVSPEYTGPLARSAVTNQTARRFREVFAEYCQRERVVSEFAHLHPWHLASHRVSTESESPDREIVYVDLRASHEELWHDSFAYACRKNIRRARSENVRVSQAASAADIEEFHRIYIDTMDRRSALARYCFSVSYFMAFFEQMPDNATFFLARHGDRVVAAVLYLHDDIDVYSYLGGADHAFQHVRPTNAVVDAAIRWAQRHGKQRLILGGGYRPDDGIFRFKASFSPLRARFSVYRCIHMPGEYASLCRCWSSYYGHDIDPNGYFPAYRAVPAMTEHEGLFPAGRQR